MNLNRDAKYQQTARAFILDKYILVRFANVSIVVLSSSEPKKMIAM